MHSNEMKLRTLLKKINADFLQQTKSSIEVDMTRTPMTMTYEMALANFRNHVNSKFSITPTPHRTRRQVQETRNTYRGRGNRGGRGGRSFRGRGGGRGNLVRKRQDSSMITLTDGMVIEYHPSFKFADDQFRKFKPEDKQKLFDDRAQYKRAKATRALSAIQPFYPAHPQFVPQYNPYIDSQISQVGMIPGTGLPPQPGSIPAQVPIIPPPPPPQSDTSTIASIMGGRNSQIGGRHYQGGRPS